MLFCAFFVLFSVMFSVLFCLHEEVCIDLNFIYPLLFLSLSLSLKVPLLWQIYGRFRPCSIIVCYTAC